MNARKKLIIPFLLPSMALVAVFFILPALQTIVLSLQDWDGTFRTTGFKGLENYFRLFQDQLFLDAVGHTFAYFVIITLLLFPIGLFLAVALQRIKRYKMFIQFCIFMPVTLSVVVAAVLWKWYIYDPNMGIINTFLRAIGWFFGSPLAGRQQDRTGGCNRHVHLARNCHVGHHDYFRIRPDSLRIDRSRKARWSR